MRRIIRLCLYLAVGSLCILQFLLWVHWRSEGTAVQESYLVEIAPGTSVIRLATQLHEDDVIRSPRFFRYAMKKTGLDRRLQAGSYTFAVPISVKDLLHTLERPFVEEREITLLPGWSLREMGTYFEEEGLVDSQEDWYDLVGQPVVFAASHDRLSWADDVALVQEKAAKVSLEGYLAPDTYRVFVGESGEDIVLRLLRQQDHIITDAWKDVIAAQGRTVHEVLTIASIVEREVRAPEDRAMVADLFWRRLDAGWGLEADSTVHYVIGGNGSVFTSRADREQDSLWNTYKYAGLPPGPIAAPSVSAIEATIFPKENPYWFFLTTLDTGEVKYGRDFAEHQRNIGRYLR